MITMFKRLLWRLNPFKSKRHGNRLSPKMYNTFMTWQAFNDQIGSMRDEIRELKGLVRQLAARDDLKVLNGILMTEKEHKLAEDATNSFHY